MAASRRRSATSCKGEAGWGHPLALFPGYYHGVLPHASLRQPLREPVATNGTGSAKQWRLCTPAMAAGLTDRVWTLREVLLDRVPPWGPSRRRSKTWRWLRIVDVERLFAFRCWPRDVEEGLNTGFECCSPAEGCHAGGMGEVSKEYPQTRGT